VANSAIEGDATEAVRLTLLRETLAWAVSRSRFNQRHFGSEMPEIRTLRDLALLPFLTKADIRNETPDLVTSREMPDFVQFTGGTLNQPTPLYRTWNEVDAWSERSSLIRAVFPGNFKKLCLRLLVPMNGPDLPVRGLSSFPMAFVLG
jgi:phenylacetate-coenzyme A ligase PaaK-like adenylate-forming protein